MKAFTPNRNGTSTTTIQSRTEKKPDDPRVEHRTTSNHGRPLRRPERRPRHPPSRGGIVTDHVDEGSVPPGESREEIVSRVKAEQEEIYQATGSSPQKDVSSKRRLGTREILIGSVGALVGAGVGLLMGIAVWNPWIPISLAIVGFVLAALFIAEREDGVVAARVDSHQQTNSTTESRSHPRHDH
jgi:F0F1-type ATP synthase assembly protein I